MDDLGFREEDQRNEPIKIAQISFAYENGWVIDTLKKRGAAIAAEKYDELKTINAEIHDKIVKEKGSLTKFNFHAQFLSPSKTKRVPTELFNTMINHK